MRLAAQVVTWSGDEQDYAISEKKELEVLSEMAKRHGRHVSLVSVRVSGAGVEACNGEYVRDGEYGGAPLFKKVSLQP